MQSSILNERAEQIIASYVNKYSFFSEIEESVRRSAEALIRSYSYGGKLLVCGNGGSSTDADHIVGELVKGFMKKRPLRSEYISEVKRMFPEEDTEFLSRAQDSLAAINLGAHVGLMTAVSNDIGADIMFVQGVLGYGKRGDVFLGISTSGNSENVIKAGMAARAQGLTAIGLTGKDGGKMKDLFDICIIVPANETADIQDMHTPVYHTLCAAVEAQYWEE